MLQTYIAVGLVIALVILFLFVTLLRAIVRSISRRRRNRRVRPKDVQPTRRRNLPNLLRNWVNRHVPSESVIAWVRGLNKRDLNDLVENLLQFGQRYGFDPNWVLEGSVEVDPELNAQLQLAMQSWITARYTAAQAKARSELYQRYQQLLMNPSTPENVALTQSLYVLLVQANLVAPTPASMIMSDDSERQKYALERIEEAAKQNWAQFATIFAATVSANQPGRGLLGGRRRQRRRARAAAAEMAANTTPAPATA